ELHVARNPVRVRQFLYADGWIRGALLRRRDADLRLAPRIRPWSDQNGMSSRPGVSGSPMPPMAMSDMPRPSPSLVLPPVARSPPRPPPMNCTLLAMISVV